MTQGIIFRTTLSIAIIVLLLAGCSGGGSTVSPETPVPPTELAQPSPGQVGAETGSGGDRFLFGLWELNLDTVNLTASIVPLRGAQPHYDITNTLQPPFCSDCLRIQVNFFDPVSRMMDVDVTIKNPYTVPGRDIRGILFTTDAGHTILNPDAWTALYDIPGGRGINPFMAFGKQNFRRTFGAQQSLTEKFYVYIPKPPQFQSIRFAADGCWLKNCQEPYAFENFEQLTPLYDYIGSEAFIEVDVLDWQDNVTKVTLAAPEITGESFTQFERIDGNRWRLLVRNNAGITNGYHEIRIIATSPNPTGIALYDYFTMQVGSLDPVISAIDPVSGPQASTVTGATITGSSFQGPGTQVKLKRSGQPDIQATNVNLIDGSTIVCNIPIPLNTQLGLWDLQVINGNLLSVTNPQMFEVLCAAPTVGSAIPNSAPYQSSVSGLLISGDNFVGPNPQVRLKRSGYPDVTATNVLLVNSQTISCDLDITCAMVGGAYDIEVMNDCGSFGTGLGVFNVFCPAPGFLSLLPPGADVGASLTGVTIVGSEFVCNNATINLNQSGSPDIPFTNVTIQSPTTITADIDIPLTAPLGFYDVEITNDCLETVISAPYFQVNCPTPAISGTSLPGANAGSDVSGVLVSGMFFKGPSVQATLKMTSAPDIPATAVQVIDDQTLSVDFSIPFDAPIGFYDLEVITGCGETTTATAIFEVICPTPVVTDMNPATWGSYPVTIINNAMITGSGFLACGGVTQVYLDNGNVQINGFDIVAYSDTFLTCDFNIDAYPWESGPYDVVVDTVSTGVGQNLFTIYDTVLFDQDFSLGNGGCTPFGTHGGYYHSGQWWDSYAPTQDPYPPLMFSALMTPPFDVPAVATDVHFRMTHSLNTDIMEGVIAGWTNNDGTTFFGSACYTTDRWFFENGQQYNSGNILSPINEGLGSNIGCFQSSGWANRYWTGSIGSEGSSVLSEFHCNGTANLIGMSNARFMIVFLADSYVGGARGHEISSLRVWYDPP